MHTNTVHGIRVRPANIRHGSSTTQTILIHLRHRRIQPPQQQQDHIQSIFMSMPTPTLQYRLITSHIRTQEKALAMETYLLRTVIRLSQDFDLTPCLSGSEYLSSLQGVMTCISHRPVCRRNR